MKRRASEGEGRESRQNESALAACSHKGVIMSLHMQSAAEPLYDKLFKPTKFS